MPTALWRQIQSRNEADPRYEIYYDLLLQSARCAGPKLLANQRIPAPFSLGPDLALMEFICWPSFRRPFRPDNR
jgi:hypothetical protein